MSVSADHMRRDVVLIVTGAHIAANGTQQIEWGHRETIGIPPIEYAIKPGDRIEAQPSDGSRILLGITIVRMRINGGPVLENARMWEEFFRAHGL